MDFSSWFIQYQIFILLFNGYWYLTYVLAIRRGYLDKAPAIPLFSLTLNLAWDIAGAFILESPGFQFIINMGYVTVNSIFTMQWFLYWRNINGFKKLNKYEFYGFWTLAMAVSMAVILLGNTELNDLLGYKIGFVDNFINSILFIAMLYNRDTVAGQSVYIGISKMLGTACMSIASLIFTPTKVADSVILVPLYIGIFGMDLLYVVLYIIKARRLGVDVWRRW